MTVKDVTNWEKILIKTVALPETFIILTATRILEGLPYVIGWPNDMTRWERIKKLGLIYI